MGQNLLLGELLVAFSGLRGKIGVFGEPFLEPIGQFGASRGRFFVLHEPPKLLLGVCEAAPEGFLEPLAVLSPAQPPPAIPPLVDPAVPVSASCHLTLRN